MLDFLPPFARTAGLETLMKGAGKLTRFIPIPQPTLMVGAGASVRMGELIASFAHEKVLIVTDAILVQLGLLQGIQEALHAGGTQTVVFDEITPDAPIPLVERGIRLCQEHDCQALIAFGGGSVMDCAKAIALASRNPKPLRSLAGYLKGRHSPLPLYAVPTTAGTGSEVTVAAVLFDPEHKDKVIIVDPRLVPKIAALDAALMTALPPHITAATGMDALTHAIESFISHWATPYSKGMSLCATDLIFAHLRTCYHDGRNLPAREKMALASTYAGLAFTRANVGYVHAIAHQLGGTYRIPHGLANAVILPHVLRYSLPAIVPELAQLAVRARVGAASESSEHLAEKFIEAVEQLNRELAIPQYLDQIQESDLAALAAAACREAMGYPVPKYMNEQQCAALLAQVMPPAKADASDKRTSKPAQRKRAKTQAPAQ